MKLMIRNTSRDKTTSALRKARPGDVQPFPVIKKVQLPPRGSVSVEMSELTANEVELIEKLIGCGCLKVFLVPGSGPMKEVPHGELRALCGIVEEAAPPEPEPEPEPEPVPTVTATDVSEVGSEPVAETEEVPYLKGELEDMKNSELRAILKEMDFGSTTGMRKAELVNAIIATQES